MFLLDLVCMWENVKCCGFLPTLGAMVHAARINVLYL